MRTEVIKPIKKTIVTDAFHFFYNLMTNIGFLFHFHLSHYYFSIDHLSVSGFNREQVQASPKFTYINIGIETI